MNFRGMRKPEAAFFAPTLGNISHPQVLFLYVQTAPQRAGCAYALFVCSRCICSMPLP